MKKFIYIILVALTLSSCATTLKTNAPTPSPQWITGAYTPEPGKFSIDVPVTIEFSSIKAQVMKEFSSISYSGIDVKILDVSVVGLDNSRIYIGVNLDAKLKKTPFKVKGWIYLIGEPVLDVESQTLTIDRMKLDVDTQQAVANIAGWLLKPIVIYESKNLKLDIRSLVESKKSMFSGYTMEGYGAVHFTIDSLTLNDLVITPTQLIARIKCEGTVDATVDIK